MPIDDIEYRERQKLPAADNSIDDYFRTIHLNLARLYGMRIIELEANSSRYADDDGFSVALRSPFIS